MKTIEIITKKNGRTILNKRAKSGVSVDDIVEIARNEVCGNYADYACVLVNGKTYRVFTADDFYDDHDFLMYQGTM